MEDKAKLKEVLTLMLKQADGLGKEFAESLDGDDRDYAQYQNGRADAFRKVLSVIDMGYTVEEEV